MNEDCCADLWVAVDQNTQDISMILELDILEIPVTRDMVVWGTGTAVSTGVGVMLAGTAASAPVWVPAAVLMGTVLAAGIAYDQRDNLKATYWDMPPMVINAIKENPEAVPEVVFETIILPYLARYMAASMGVELPENTISSEYINQIGQHFPISAATVVNNPMYLSAFPDSEHLEGWTNHAYEINGEVKSVDSTINSVLASSDLSEIQKQIFLGFFGQMSPTELPNSLMYEVFNSENSQEIFISLVTHPEFRARLVESLKSDGKLADLVYSSPELITSLANSPELVTLLVESLNSDGKLADLVYASPELITSLANSPELVTLFTSGETREAVSALIMDSFVSELNTDANGEYADLMKGLIQKLFGTFADNIVMDRDGFRQIASYFTNALFESITSGEFGIAPETLQRFANEMVHALSNGQNNDVVANVLATFSTIIIQKVSEEGFDKELLADLANTLVGIITGEGNEETLATLVGGILNTVDPETIAKFLDEMLRQNAESEQIIADLVKEAVGTVEEEGSFMGKEAARIKQLIKTEMEKAINGGEDVEGIIPARDKAIEQIKTGKADLRRTRRDALTDIWNERERALNAIRAAAQKAGSPITEEKRSDLLGPYQNPVPD